MGLIQPLLENPSGSTGGKDASEKGGKRKSSEAEKEGKAGRVVSVELRRKFVDFGRQVLLLNLDL